MRKRINMIFLLTVSMVSISISQVIEEQESLNVMFSGDAKIEIGSNLCGLEFHHSKALPQRVSFYYPLANSIDQSRDYWTRDTSFVSSANMLIDDAIFVNLAELKYTTEYSPYYAGFTAESNNLGINVEYNFIKELSLYVVDYSFKNLLKNNRKVNFTTSISKILRSSHSYNWFNPAHISALEDRGYSMEYSQPDVGGGSIVYQYDCSEMNNSDFLSISKNYEMIYNLNIKPSEVIKVRQVVGSAKIGELVNNLSVIRENIDARISDFTSCIKSLVDKDHYFRTGESTIDHSVLWGKSMLEVNRHLIDGEYILMPCPAEYNFFFTHDVLLSDLAVSKYNPARVKSDLQFIIKNVKEDNIIPHAYYWKDNGYKVEYAGDDNWNHLWFTIISGTYLRHSGDTEFIKKIYPVISKSIRTILENKIVDGLVCSHRPDWWDAGDNTGPRSYMTLLAYKALMEYVYVSSTIDKMDKEVAGYYELANELKKNIVEKLWDDDYEYLMNYLKDGKIDEHYYMGSILALHYGLLDEEYSQRMIKTVEDKLLDKEIGIFNVFPMDIDKVADILDLKNGEEGKYGYYFNGGIWSHANAFYILGLMHNGEKEKAYEYLKKLMTVEGITKSPNGQPAMYEYRVAAGENYGLIDKPNFSWAASWYMYSLYNLNATNETIWNVTLNPFLSREQDYADFSLFAYGKKVNVDIGGNGDYCSTIIVDGKTMSSLVLPRSISENSKVEIQLGSIEQAYLKEISATLLDCDYQDKKMNIVVDSTLGDAIKFQLVSISRPKLCKVNSEIVKADIREIDAGVYELELKKSGKETNPIIEVTFN